MLFYIIRDRYKSSVGAPGLILNWMNSNMTPCMKCNHDTAIM
jgi:hypothetical protein